MSFALTASVKMRGQNRLQNPRKLWHSKSGRFVQICVAIVLGFWLVERPEYSGPPLRGVEIASSKLSAGHPELWPAQPDLSGRAPRFA
jgi:hypothetical protein